MVGNDSNEKATMVYLSPEEVHQMAVNIDNVSDYPKRDKCIFLIGCRLGLLASELSSIEINDVDFESKYLKVGKKVFALDDDTFQLIKDCMEERRSIALNAGVNEQSTNALFIKKCNGKFGPASKYHVATMLNKARCGIKKHITPQVLKNTCVINMYNITGSVEYVSKRMGQDTKTTERYIDVMTKMANILK